MEHGVSREQIIGELNRSAHGALETYAPIVNRACANDPEFLAHLIAWDFVNGQIKDSKLALPVLTLGHPQFPDELVENSLAHLAMQPPREILKALRFGIKFNMVARRQRKFDRLVRRYLISKHAEPGKWMRVIARQRRSVHELYALSHCPRPEWVGDVLFASKYAPGTIFADIAILSKMDPKSIAAAVQKWHLSPLVVSGAMAGAKAKQEDSSVVQATIEQMSDTELITRTASLERKGLSRDATLKETFKKKAAKAVKSTKATLKTSVAAEEVEDEGLRETLRELQERQIESQKQAGRGIDGNWLIIADKSGSQMPSIEVGKAVAAAVAKFVTGKVWLVFCDTSVAPHDVSHLSLDEIRQRTRFVNAGGGTSYGVGLEWAARNEIDGIAIVGDGAENQQPIFVNVLVAYKTATKRNPPVYLYKTASTEPPHNCENFARLMATRAEAFTEFDLRHGQVDYYSIPNLVQQMSVNRFSIIDRIMACPLVTLDQVLPQPAAIGR